MLSPTGRIRLLTAGDFEETMHRIVAWTKPDAESVALLEPTFSIVSCLTCLSIVNRFLAW